MILGDGCIRDMGVQRRWDPEGGDGEKQEWREGIGSTREILPAGGG